MDPPAIRPGGRTSPSNDNAVTDFPLPDSPTSASVSPARITKLTARTASASRSPRSKTVVRRSTCSMTGRSAVSLVNVTSSLGVCLTNGLTGLPVRGARLTRRDEGTDRQYSTAEPRRQMGCPAREVSSHVGDTPLESVLAMFTEHGAKRVGDLAHGGPGLDGGDDGRDQIRPAQSGLGDPFKCPSQLRVIT